jgi:hypothetical protein
MLQIFKVGEEQEQEEQEKELTKLPGGEGPLMPSL